MRWSSGFPLLALVILAIPTSQVQCPCGASKFDIDDEGSVVFFQRGSCSWKNYYIKFVWNNRGVSNDRYCYGTITYRNCTKHGCSGDVVANPAYQIEVMYNNVNYDYVESLIRRNKPNSVEFRSDQVMILFRCSPTKNCKDYYGADLFGALKKDGIHDVAGNVITVPDADKEHLPKASELLKSIASEIPPPRSMRFDVDYIEFPVSSTSTTTTTSTTATSTATSAKPTARSTTTAPSTSYIAPPTSFPEKLHCECDCESKEGKNPKDDKNDDFDRIWFLSCIIFSLWGVMVGIWVLLYRA